MKNTFKLLIISVLFTLMMQSFAISITAPAVAQTDYGYKGVPVNIEVIVTKGDGHVFMDTMPLTQLDMQGSARIASKVAFDIAGKNVKDYNVYYIVRSDVPIVGGPSAGATLCVATIAELNNWSLNKNVMMTGMINPDGSIGPVGGILEKIEAAKECGCNYFLIPKGERYVNRDGKTVDAVEFGKKLGINVIEIESIYDALYYFTNHKLKKKTYSPNPIIEEKYTKSMRVLATDILKKSKEKYAEVEEKLKNNYFGYEYQNSLENELKEAEDLIKKEDSQYMDGKYYASTCSGFNAIIKLETIDATIDYFNGEDVKKYLLNIQNDLEHKKEIINSHKITKNNIEFVIAAKNRIFEGENFLDSAWKSYYSNSPIEAIKYGAYAKCRGESAIWWLNLSPDNGGETIDTQKLKQLSQEYLDNAETIVLYSSMVMPSPLVDEGDKKLNYAKKAYNERDYLLTISNSIDASVLATTSLEFMNDYNYLRNLAREKINIAESYGILPMSALGYYEYAESLNDTISKIMYYKYATSYAQMDIDILKAISYISMDETENTTSYYNNSNHNKEKPQFEKTEPINTLNVKNTFINITYLVVGLICGLFGGYYLRNK
ncbi:S16 family serine protease [Methanotorris formicicus]|uniref:Lon proteolytic domain-containing protein n=1 Tax=Methanotorris formicicus Mc-S-70 TaxID=647171 RepID=H1KZX7_9EURY|nr:S16 family serine protease [Methanotorris formicicus]EHP85480.1 hypothetical protein MetfoDRAFT_1351 [Methanotorris formicicus Mc-S-70]